MIKFEITAFNPEHNISRSLGEFDTITECHRAEYDAHLPPGTLVDIQRYEYARRGNFSPHIERSKFVESRET